MDVNLRVSARLGDKDSQVDTGLFDVKFYPYTAPSVDPVFAVVGGEHTFVCRLQKPENEKLEINNGIEILRWFKDEDTDHEYGKLNSLTWSKDSAGDPLVCVSGVSPKIKILNVKTGKLINTLIGHGQIVNDLTTSPLCPSIIASGSQDCTIRLWNLNPARGRSPCMLILAGQGTKETILSVSFHPCGRYLISGGMDTQITLWALPELDGDAPPQDDGKVDVMHFPHFSTREVHADYVDCVQFYGDLVLSRAANENKIILWKIDGFSSTNAVPDRDAVPPVDHKAGLTRSCFGGKFQVLLQFEVPLSENFYMRFSLFHQPDMRPIMGIGTQKSKFLFWDLQSLEEGVPRKAQTAKGKEKQTDGAESKDMIDDPFQLIPAQKTISASKKVDFAGRQMAWSNDGEWCVGVGDFGMVCVFSRNV
ncbi:WD40 repeat-like protein [Aulographum hederae CBS 113979]|uniref:WD40 repeat-like protein n=1 Tax=Aulographum hederae CBS 113979 TaxID=1176131 RepID=A0A6G1H3R0_9PEZI|nr:WD40 repeat-like protein [Aulographum hederae CBS 113979]